MNYQQGNESKPDVTDGETPSMDQQVGTEKQITPAEKITNNKTINDSGSSKQMIPPEIKEDKLAANKRNMTQRSNTQCLEPVPSELSSLPQSPKNKTPAVEKSEAPKSHRNPSAPNIKLCTV